MPLSLRGTHVGKPRANWGQDDEPARMQAKYGQNGQPKLPEDSKQRVQRLTAVESRTANVGKTKLQSAKNSSKSKNFGVRDA